MFESLRRFYSGWSRMRRRPTAIVRGCSTRPLLETLGDPAGIRPRPPSVSAWPAPTAPSIGPDGFRGSRFGNA